MPTAPRNPFNITKAVDFSDQQILDTWVDLPTAGGFFELADPTSPMPLLLLGGKGSGRTHLMRYFSYPIQALRHGEEGVSGLLGDGYIGIYLRCSGLNAGRFAGKGQPPEVWDDVFNHYMDLWLAQLTLAVYDDLASRSENGDAWSRAIAHEAVALFDRVDFLQPQSISELSALLRHWQRDLDAAINNAALSQTLDANIRATRGRLVFGLPSIAARIWRPLDGIQILYLLDEFENLTVDQQRYINTLVREKDGPTSFFIGSRLYGIKTLETYSAGEENKEGSEFEWLRLDSLYFTERDQYGQFARRVIAQRLREYGYSGESQGALAIRISDFFEEIPRSALGDRETEFALRDGEGPHLRRLRGQLSEASRQGTAPGVTSAQQVAEVMALIETPAHPLVEKVNCFLVYRAWSDGLDLPEASRRVAADAQEYINSQSAATQHAKVMRHFRGDLIAQMLRDFHLPQRYIGLDSFVDMSGGLLRNLLIILKDVYRWASFNGERPFVDGPLSVRAQQEGVREAANWFFNDAQLAGDVRDDVRDGISRLGNMLRRMRFSDKPSESSLAAFSADLSRTTPPARATVQAAVEWSLLLSIGAGQRERNTDQVDAKFQLHPMLCPRWDLPIHRRGAISMASEEMTAVFDLAAGDVAYDRVVAARLSRLNAPFRRQGSGQESLPGVDGA